jgi:hypothetical protein
MQHFCNTVGTSTDTYLPNSEELNFQLTIHEETDTPGTAEEPSEFLFLSMQYVPGNLPSYTV